VLTWLADIDENTFYKWQRRASDLIATLLWEENCKLEQPGQIDRSRTTRDTEQHLTLLSR
jgi:hypothetical protein